MDEEDKYQEESKCQPRGKSGYFYPGVDNEDIRRIKERINHKGIPTRVNWTDILMAIRNQADQEIESYLRSVGISNLDWGKDKFPNSIF